MYVVILIILDSTKVFHRCKPGTRLSNVQIGRVVRSNLEVISIGSAAGSITAHHLILYFRAIRGHVYDCAHDEMQVPKLL